MGPQLSKANDCLAQFSAFLFGLRDSISYLNLVPHSSLTAWRLRKLVYLEEPPEKKRKMFKKLF